MTYAPRALKLQMSALDRRFYRGRMMSADAVKCLINDALRHKLNHSRSWRSARPEYVESKNGRPVYV